jgi:hypothetical protein
MFIALCQYDYTTPSGSNVIFVEKSYKYWTHSGSGFTQFNHGARSPDLHRGTHISGAEFQTCLGATAKKIPEVINSGDDIPTISIYCFINL